MSQARFQKRQREMAKAEKAKAKAARKAERLEGADDEQDDAPAVDAESVMTKLEALHKAFADDQMAFDDFETAKQELLSQLQV